MAALSSLFWLPALLILAYYGYFQLSGKIVPGVSVGPDRLGGLTVEQAAIHIHTTWNMQQSIQVNDQLQVRTIAPAELGLSVDAYRTALSAYSVGHGQGMLVEISQTLGALFKPPVILPIVSYDRSTASTYLQAVSNQITQEAQNATIQLEGDRLVAVPSQLGYTVNLEQSLSTLENQATAIIISGQFAIALKPLSPRVLDAGPALAQAENLLSTPFALQAYDPISDEHFNWTVDRPILAGWLRIEPDGEGSRLGLQPDKIAASLDQFAAQLGDGRFLDPETASHQVADAFLAQRAPVMVVKHPPTTFSIQPGDTLLKIAWRTGFPFWMILQANPGLDPDLLVAGQTLNLPSQDDLLPYPVIPNKRIVISISQQHLWAYQDGQLWEDHKISTGVDKSPTQPGIFQVQTHDPSAYASVWDLTMPNFLGIYEAWPGFMNGIHGLPTLSNGRLLWGSILGKPASYGCIIMDLKPAERLYNWAENGVVVEIQP
jgi:lipoprotein-anchoring transpeptidase ErfK/SrfK